MYIYGERMKRICKNETRPVRQISVIICLLLYKIPLIVQQRVYN